MTSIQLERKIITANLIAWTMSLVTNPDGLASAILAESNLQRQNGELCSKGINGLAMTMFTG